MTEIDVRNMAFKEASEHLCARLERDADWVNGNPYCVGYQDGAEHGAQWAVEQLPSRDEIADAMIAGNPDYEVTQVTEGERDWYLRDADAVLALIREAYEPR